jgi:hypothetical protein
MNAEANEVVVAEQQPSTSLLQVIERAARDPNVDIDKMERLLSMQQTIVAREAEAQFNAALVRCQVDMRPIAADADNPQTRSRYASYHQLDKALRPIYTKYGFALSFDEADCPKPDYVRVVCYVSHASGFTRSYHRDMPADGKGAKGGDVMTKTHAAGAAQAYGMRYLVKAIFNVSVGEDRDGNDAPTITEKQAADLQALITEHGGNLGKLLKYLKLSRLEEIPAANYNWVVEEVRRLAGLKDQRK